MSFFAYKIDCITNLHVGSGDLNYNIVDNEVERDAVTGYPVIHASGLKGALREHCSKSSMFSDRKRERLTSRQAPINSSTHICLPDRCASADSLPP